MDMKKFATWYSIATSLVAVIVYIFAGVGVFYTGDIRETDKAPPFILFSIASAITRLLSASIVMPLLKMPCKSNTIFANEQYLFEKLHR